MYGRTLTCSSPSKHGSDSKLLAQVSAMNSRIQWKKEELTQNRIKFSQGSLTVIQLNYISVKQRVAGREFCVRILASGTDKREGMLPI